jgi:hypothetical protein
MVSIDIDICNPVDSVLVAEIFNGDTAVIDNTEAGGNVAPGMMQSGYRYECSIVLIFDQSIDCIANRACDCEHGFIHANERRRISLVKKTAAQFGHVFDFSDVIRFMEQFENILCSHDRSEDINLLVKRFAVQCFAERIMAQWTKRMLITECIAGKLFS